MHLGSVGVSRNGGRTAKGWNIAICMLLAGVLGLCLMLWITPPVHADDSAGLGITATDDITDTQNLLGSNVSEITDAINQTKKETGVTVRLVYLDSFNAKGKPDKWVSALLESLNPKPNTVMLAVASNDGTSGGGRVFELGGMAEEEVDRRRAVRCRAKTVDGKRSGLGEVRDRHDESDFGAEKTSLRRGPYGLAWEDSPARCCFWW